MKKDTTLIEIQLQLPTIEAEAFLNYFLDQKYLLHYKTFDK